uniref:Tyr recombinase domain-containing protein n=1 Tax=uncultured marine group II/III euryarchaeote KM3_92_B07 TaxID=1456543 RepID=A0A075HYT0_9EURY|nr:hypothetical protein [uncultured marine group II/III euryarchaeote KM3_92_B07]
MTQDNDPKMPDDERDPSVVSPEWKRYIRESMKRAEASGRSKGSIQNIKSYGKQMALEFQSLGFFDPNDIDRDAFIGWHKLLKEKGFVDEYKVKRNDTAKRVFEHDDLVEQLKLANQWKIKVKAPEITYFTDEERLAIRRVIIDLSKVPETLMYAVVGILAMSVSPRVSDMAAAKWSDFRWAERSYSYIAQKNGNRCTAPMDPLFFHIMRAWGPYVGEFEGGDVWVFPKAVIAKEGGRRNNSPIISEKTVRKWLNEKVRDKARLPNGSPVQKLSPHHWRHTNAMAILRQTGDYYLVKGLLGDSIKTIERRYSTFIYNEAAGERISACLAPESTKSGPLTGDVWPLKQITDAEQGEYGSDRLDITLTAQSYDVQDFMEKPDAASLDDERPNFYEWRERHHRTGNGGSDLNTGYGGLGQIGRTNAGQVSNEEYSGPGEI